MSSMKAAFYSVLLCVIASQVEAQSNNWGTGANVVKWEDSYLCGSDTRCVRIYQQGLGIPGLTPNCFRKQVLITSVTNVPSTIKSYSTYREDGLWRVGIDKVVFEKNRIDISTYLIQDH